MAGHLSAYEALGDAIDAYKSRIVELEQINGSLQQTIQRLQIPATEAADSA